MYWAAFARDLAWITHNEKTTSRKRMPTSSWVSFNVGHWQSLPWFSKFGYGNRGTGPITAGSALSGYPDAY
jgi:hypothetical protein